ncbi:MAG TPA: glycoside hydrolase family 3 C-terminal domain-containing protein [Armatimonadota bacterium]|nr:glycoside hydrolase family 3 C-terminal domain-containing protein [Armatimonadota bacterium]
MSKGSNRNSITRRDFLAIGAAAAFYAAGGFPGETGAAAAAPAGSGEIYGINRDAFLSAQQRAHVMANAMTAAEKVSQLGNNAPAVPRLKLPRYNYYSGEALHGLVRGGPVTAFPLPLATVNSWNPDLQLQIYTAVSDEARAYHNHSGADLAYYSPQTLNTAKDPRWGRIQETLGEDPHLISVMAVQAVRGMQGNHPDYLKTVCCAKHYIANETEDDRTSVSETVDPRSFWEYYSQPFRACVVEGKVFSVMGAYNAVNGVPCCADKNLITTILRDTWGFKGYVTSDCDAIANIYEPHHYATSYVEAAAMGIGAGCDLDCGGTYPRNLMAALNQKLVSEADLTLSVERLLTARFLFGDFDPPAKCPYNQIPFSVVDSPKHRALALEAARQSIVLLKNDGILPLNPAQIQSVAVIGPTAGSAILGGYSGSPFVRISPMQGIATALGITIHHQEVWASEIQAFGGGAQTEGSSEGGTDVGFITNGSWVQFPVQDFTGKTEMVFRVASATQGGTIEVHLDSLNGPVAAKVTVPPTGAWQNWRSLTVPLHGVTGKHKVFFRFAGGGGDLLNVEWFKLNPTPPPVSSAAGKPTLVFKPGCTVTGAKDDTMFNEAVDAARAAQLAIVVAGVDEQVDSEGRDRLDIKLTGVQHELIQAVYAANPKTILVISSNAPVAVTWEQDNLPAIVSAIFAGQAQGTAIADVLFGNTNPGGKLAETWYRSIDDIPPQHDMDITKRTYMYFEGQPLYPFGYGLSYTTFGIHDVSLRGGPLRKGGSVRVSASVTNTGHREGAQVVQLYVRPPQSPVKRPMKQLVDFQRVVLRPGQTKRVNLTLSYDAPALWYWDEAKKDFVLQPGTVELMLGDSSVHIVSTGRIEVA